VPVGEGRKGEGGEEGWRRRTGAMDLIFGFGFTDLSNQNFKSRRKWNEDVTLKLRTDKLCVSRKEGLIF
jgi:hypothetical protein